MKIAVVPMLQSLRAIYDVDGVMPRFNAYTDLMTNGSELLPLGAFSPMGRAQPRYLDKLLEMNAEGIATETAKQAEEELINDDDFRLKLVMVVVDAPQDKNTWTHRYLTDAEWKLEGKYDCVPGDSTWSTIQLWTDVDTPTPFYIVEKTRAAIYRGMHRKQHGIPTTLQEMMHQEGKAMAFVGCKLTLDKNDLQHSRNIIQGIRQTDHYPTCFAALYGDGIAESVGYPTLGLSQNLAGFQVALADAKMESNKRKNPIESPLWQSKQ